MKWLLDHPQLAFMAVFLVMAFLANQAKVKKAREEQRRAAERRAQRPRERDEDDGPVHAFDDDGEDAGMEERTRRIQEEIRRKILERMSGGQEPAPPLSRPATQPVPRPVQARPPPLPQVKEEKRDTTPAFDWDEAARQQKLAEQMRELEEQRKVAERRSKAFATARPAPKGVPLAGASRLHRRVTVAGDLRDPAALRRAVVLREVLGPPVGSRRP